MFGQEPIIQTIDGLIKGIKRTNIYGTDYYCFEGIPYARPPVNEWRFRDPVDIVSWEGVLTCQNLNAKPCQKNIFNEVEGEEDCLYLNVYVKTQKVYENLPVMVWLHGGAFNTGSGVRNVYGPDHFIEENVIIVTVNYRVGIFGFLCMRSAECEVPGNAGLKDQVVALQWVKDNIESFGGNDENITLFGSDGAAVHYMAITSQTKRLFHKVICMSGVALNPWAYCRNTTALPYRVAVRYGYDGPKYDRMVLSFLRSLSTKQLVLIDQFNKQAFRAGGQYAFVPCIESYENNQSIITKNPQELVDQCWTIDLPMMIGGTSCESLIKYQQLLAKPLHERYVKHNRLYLPPRLRHSLTPESRSELIKEIKKLHYENRNNIMGFIDYDSFASYWAGIHHFVKSRLAILNVPTYQYVFDFDSPNFNHNRRMFCGSHPEMGVPHGDELSYLFYSHCVNEAELNTMEYKTMKRMIKMWTSFAKTSDPNCEYTANAQWRPVNDDNLYKWLKISNELSFEDMPSDFKNKLQLWATICERTT